jgi:hypothetical protein
MYLTIILGLIVAVRLMVKLARSSKAKTTTMARALCHGCAHVYKVQGFKGQVLLSCSYGPELRAIKFAVRECTGYRSDTPPAPVRVAGFVRLDEVTDQGAFPETVIRISR